MEGLEIIEPSTAKVTLSTGREVIVRPVTMGQLPRFIAAVEPLLGAIGGLPQEAQELALFAALAKHGDAVNSALSVTTKLTAEDFEEMGVDDGALLVLAVFRVNRDLFQRRLLPMLAQALAPESPPA